MKYVNTTGKWSYPGNPVAGLRSLSKSKLRCPILDLSGILLNELPDCLDRILDLEEIYLDQNNLFKLPPSLGYCPKLRVLSLGRNNISKLPNSIKERWHTLEILYLGQNQFTENPLDEDSMMMFKQGSIGSNPIPEPISPLWMTKQDAIEFPDRIFDLLVENTSQPIQDELYQRAYEIVKQCPEPMIFENLFQNVEIANSRIKWSDKYNSPIRRRFGESILPLIPRGSLVHRSIIDYLNSLPSK